MGKSCSCFFLFVWMCYPKWKHLGIGTFVFAVGIYEQEMTQCGFPGTQYAQQSYKVSDSFPFKWINKKWKEGFYVTAMATAGSRWAVVMSRNAGFSAQVCASVSLILSVHKP